MEKGIAIIGNLGTGFLMPLFKIKAPGLDMDIMFQQPRLIEQPEERQKIDLMALIQKVSGIGKRGLSLAEIIGIHRSDKAYHKVYYRVSSGLVIKDFLRKRNGYSRISK